MVGSWDGYFREVESVVFWNMVSRPTKYQPDYLFSRIAILFYNSDVFCSSELPNVAATCGEIHIELSCERISRIENKGLWEIVSNTLNHRKKPYRSARAASEFWKFINLQVTRSTIRESFVDAFPGSSNYLFLVRVGCDICLMMLFLIQCQLLRTNQWTRKLKERSCRSFLNVQQLHPKWLLDTID